ncbi:DUF4286 family protein [Flavobacterium sp. HSC-61S13]|uniref:DUF4286 family protein n=1 Tax=Flavobacterium sp. HSC-61S13 TaxID=2910963 RepID=UPI0020A0E7E7|nr:DUF4286 family protein [Flavobacterium sp. HSC-61S13]MCP1997131.1 hypothetical protein [Flavobacterium sp. HSC-61S13]
MIVYNLTINIHESVHDQWIHWMQTKHITDILATGKFESARLVKVLVNEEMGGVTYSVQFTSKDKETLDRFYLEDAAKLEQEAQSLYGDKMLTFKTELEIISEH